MKIKLFDEVLAGLGLDINKIYEVVSTEIEDDDLYYIVKNEKNEYVDIHELLAEVI